MRGSVFPIQALMRRRWQRVTRSPAQKAAVDPLLQMLNEIVQPGLDAKRYAQLRDDVDDQLAYERDQLRRPSVFTWSTWSGWWWT